MKNIIYKGPFKNYIQDYLELKRSLGYKYEINATNLKYFDRLTLEKYPKSTVLTKEIVLDWCKKRIYEAQANQHARASIIRQFGKYLDSIGVKAFILPKGYYPKGRQYVPYIYTFDELTRFFAATDKCRYCRQFPHRHEIMSVIFRMIYMCGLRVSEARLLKVADVDLKNGILSINNSKKNNSRLVPMSDVLTKRCRSYSKKVHPFSISGDYYFPNPSGKPIIFEYVYQFFRRFLWQARISHGGRGRGPRIQDLRHTYAINCLKKWAEQEKDLTVYLPMLKTYMAMALR